MESQRKQMPTGILTSAYRAATTVAAPLVAAGMACSARGRRRYGERFGFWSAVPHVPWWMHGASVGEVQGLLPLISEVRNSCAADKILLTSTSPTGLDRAGESVDFRRLLPIDVGVCVRQAFSRVGGADRFVLAETELWPTALAELLANQIPIHIVNGRISDYTLSWYRRLSSIFTPLLSQVASVSVAHESQRERYLDLGVAPEVIHVTGHTKYDTEPKVLSDEARAAVCREFFPDSSIDAPIVVLGSLRPHEEDGWFAAIRELFQRGARVRVVVAPRHMERVEYFSQRLNALGLNWRLWSDTTRNSCDVVLLDTMGRLEHAYSIAQLAFVGGTLVDIGGHNPLEPAMYGVPVVVGPYNSVIRDVVEEMRSSDGVLEISTEGELRGVLDRVVAADPTLREVGTRGRGVWLKHRGASKRVLSVIAHA
jgi:3-deoxy-D-manno-octulosonic-acid transferase